MINILTLTASMMLCACAGAIDYDKYPIKDVFPQESGSDTPDDPGHVADPHKVDARKNSTSAWNTYTAYTVDRIPGFKPSQDPEVDEYGGWKIKAESAPDGFFRVRKINGRWWMIDPLGNLFLSKAVAVFSPGGSERQQAALKAQFGTNSSWAASESQMLRDNGFNSLGAWSTTYINNRNSVPQKMPYTVIVSPMGSYNGALKASGKEAQAYSKAGWEGYPYDFAFVFDEAFDAQVEKTMATVSQYANDPYLIGYFIDNEIPWKDYALERCLENWPSTHINHIKAQEWLDARKGKAGATLASATVQDKKAFIAYCLEVYLEKVTKALRKYDSNHLFLGCRFNQWNYELKNDEIFKVAGKYMDIISINHYQKWEPDAEAMRNWEAWSGKPFFVTEFYTKGEDSGLGNTTGAGWNVKTQNDRGLFYENFVNGLIKSGVCVGWHWFTYMDNDPTNKGTDSSNIDSNKGIVTWDFQRYNPLLEHMKSINDCTYNLVKFYDK